MRPFRYQFSSRFPSLVAECGAVYAFEIVYISASRYISHLVG